MKTNDLRFTENRVAKNGDQWTITIRLNDECKNGFQKFEKRFPLNHNWNVKERFSNNGGPFGEPKHFVTNTAWITTPFSLVAKITVLDYQDVEETIYKVLDAQKRYKEYKENKD